MRDHPRVPSVAVVQPPAFPLETGLAVASALRVAVRLAGVVGMPFILRRGGLAARALALAP